MVACFEYRARLSKISVRVIPESGRLLPPCALVGINIG